MRTLIVLLGIWGLSIANARPETNRVDLHTDFSADSQAALDRTMRFQTNGFHQRFGMNISYSGILPQIKRADNLWQLINPLAPAKYGDAYQNVTRHPLTGRPDGIVVFRISFGPAERKVKLPPR